MKAYLKMFPTILVGNALIAFSICAFVVPHGIMLGGCNGIGLAIKQLIDLPLSVLSAILNTSFFFLGLIFLGKKFAASSLLSTVLYPLILAVCERLPLAEIFQGDLFISSVCAGVGMGAGIGLVVRAGGSTGGMDIPPCILQKYKGIPVGTSLLVFDGLIIFSQIFLQGFDGLLYSLACLFLTSVTIDKLIVAGERKLQLIIISDRFRDIQQEILQTLESGLTLLDSETGFDAQNQKALLVVIYAKKYPAIKEATLSIDPSAFIIASEVTGVNGRGYTLQRSYSTKAE